MLQKYHFFSFVIFLAVGKILLDTNTSANYTFPLFISHLISEFVFSNLTENDISKTILNLYYLIEILFKFLAK